MRMFLHHSGMTKQRETPLMVARADGNGTRTARESPEKTWLRREQNSELQVFDHVGEQGH
jgi:hypothetical protein